MYQADFVPVGQDQVAHVELTREVARRFNQFYWAPSKTRSGRVLRGADVPEAKRVYVFPEPQPLLTPAAKLPGTDGRKMSKSYGNFINLSDPEPVVRQKLKTMVTDPARVRRTDPGNPDVCPVGDLHKIFSNEQTLANVYAGLPDGGHRLHRVQGLGGRQRHDCPRSHPGAAPSLRTESEACLGCAGGRFGPGADRGATND